MNSLTENYMRIPGETVFHEEVIINLATTLKLLLRDNGYKIYAQGLRCSPNSGQYYYPGCTGDKKKYFQTFVFLNIPLSYARY